MTFASPSGSYTKVGRSYLAAGRVTWPTTANGNGATIAGLPTNSIALQFPISIGYSDYATHFRGLVQGSSTSISLYDLAGNPLTNAALSGKLVVFSVPYIGAS